MSNYIVDPFQNFGPSPPPTDITRNAWVEIGRTTLGAPADLISIVIPKKRYLMVLYKIKAVGGTMEMNERFNADAGNNYANRRSINGSADAIVGNNNKIDIQSGVPINWEFFGVQYIDNNPVGEKLVTDHDMSNAGVVGSGAIPWRQELIGKWANQFSQITQIDMVNGGSGDYDTGSEVVVLGFDPTDGGDATQNFWQKLGSVAGPSIAGTGLIDFISLNIIAKKYLWIQGYAEQGDASLINQLFNFNGSDPFNVPEYSERYSDNGLADVLGRINRNNIQTLVNSSSGNALADMFVVNELTEEKLVIHHMVNNSVDGAVTPPNRREGVAKWDQTGIQITKVSMISGDVGFFGPNSFLTVWGHD